MAKIVVLGTCAWDFGVFLCGVKSLYRYSIYIAGIFCINFRLVNYW